jgi:uncharacterized delta-60 repeat protein
MNHVLPMRVAFVAAALSLAVLAAGWGGSAPIAQTSCAFRLAAAKGWLMYPNAPIAELPDGSLVVGATHQYHGTVSLVLRRVTQDCRLVSTFGNDGTTSVGTSGSGGGEIDVIDALPNGNLLVAGSAGGHVELVGRLLPNGQLDHSFGTDGWTRFRPHVKNLGMGTGRVATSIAVDPSGSIFLGGNDETAHCCTVSYVSKLSADGALDRSFGNGGTVILPNIAGSYVSDVFANPDGTVYEFALYEQSGCAIPVVDRVRPDGSLDRQFDAVMTRTLRRVQRAPLRFTPTLVPGLNGAFVLIGGLDKTCALPSRHQPSGGAVVEVTPAGRLAGERKFSAANYAFDGPAAIGLPSGAIVAAAALDDSQYRLKSVIVRWFTSDGAPTGISTIRRSSFQRAVRLDGLLPASDGGAWLVMSSRKTFRLIPVR